MTAIQLYYKTPPPLSLTLNTQFRSPIFETNKYDPKKARVCDCDFSCESGCAWLNSPQNDVLVNVCSNLSITTAILSLNIHMIWKIIMFRDKVFGILGRFNAEGRKTVTFRCCFM